MSKLTLSEKSYISDNRHKDPEALARFLEKPVGVISKYLDNLIGVKGVENVISPVLRGKPIWKFIKRQFIDEELEYYEESYNSMLEQFKEDVVFTEEDQVHKAIELNIFMMRNKLNRARTVEHVKWIEEQLEVEIALDRAEQDPARIASLRDQLSGMQSVITSTNKEYTDLLNQHTKIMEGLQGTRNQLRSKQLDSTKRDILAVMKDLDDEDYRMKHIVNSKLSRLALEQKRKELSSLHTYADQNPDIPILKADSYDSIESADD